MEEKLRFQREQRKVEFYAEESGQKEGEGAPAKRRGCEESSGATNF